MNRKLFNKIIDEVYDYCELAVLHNDGEPLMNAHLADMIKYAKQHNIKTMISTNVTLLNQDLAADLIEAGLDIIIFAIDGSKKETYEKIRKGAQYEKVINNVLGVINKKKELKRKNPFIIVQLIEMEQNMHEIQQFKKYWSNYPVKVFVKPFNLAV